MPTTLVGVGSKFGGAKQSDFDTEADATVSIARFAPDAFGVDITTEMIADVGLRCSNFMEPSDQGAITVEGSIGPVDARYEEPVFEVALAQIMGALAAPSVLTDGYEQVYTVGDNQYYQTLVHYNAGHVGSVCTNGIHAIVGADVTEMKISGEASGKIVYELTVNGKQKILDSSVNTSMQDMPATLKGKLLQQNKVFRINNNSDGALDSGDELKLKSWTITMTRAKKVDIFANSSQYRQETEPNGFWDFVFEGTLTKQNDDSWNNRYHDNEHVKCDLIVTGPLIGTDYYGLKIEIPRAEITKYTANVGGPEEVEPEIGFKVISSNTPTGMSAIASPIQITLTNTRTTSVVA